TLELAPLARQLDGAFVGFGAAVGKEDAIKARSARQALGQIHRWLVVEGGRGVDQLFGLCTQGANDLGGAVAQAIDRPALYEIQISLAIMIFDPGTLSTN